MNSTFNDGKLQAKIILSRGHNKKSYAADLIGHVEFTGSTITRFDIVSKGIYLCPEPKKLRKDLFHVLKPGQYTLAIAFSLASGDDPSDRITPYFLRGKNPKYLNSGNSQ